MKIHGMKKPIFHNNNCLRALKPRGRCMKRRILWLISITVCLGLFVSCQNDRFYLDLSAFGEAFREENAEMFYHEKCDHFLRYRKIYDNPGINGNQYHIVYCHWGHCSFEEHVEPHTIDLSSMSLYTGISVKENGYIYHRVLTECQLCGAQIIWFVLCHRQDKSCGLRDEGCLNDMDCSQNIKEL